MATINTPTAVKQSVSRHGVLTSVSQIAPGVALCLAVTLGAWGLQLAEARLFGHVWLETLVLAILLGTAVRSLWTPGTQWEHGIHFSAKTLLEIAVVLLGASLSATALKAAGVGLLAGIVAVVIIAISVSYGIGRALGLHHRMAMLVACGNSICGNSAIAAVAPVINADSDDVAASIAFTAVLGVLVVLGLPLLIPVFHLSDLQYGTLAGLTVYAVPQVLAATVPVSTVSAHLGTLVKLVRVLMLGPVILILSIVMRRNEGHHGDHSDDSAASTPAASGPPIARAHAIAWQKVLPWFIIGFLALMAARSVGVIPQPLLQPLGQSANLLTIVSMAALGLGVDVRTVAKAGPRVTAAVVLSIVALAIISLLLIYLLKMA
jgi:uncharacterized integral membrane protein (TIGR00698 family)